MLSVFGRAWVAPIAIPVPDSSFAVVNYHFGPLINSDLSSMFDRGFLRPVAGG